MDPSQPSHTKAPDENSSSEQVVPKNGDESEQEDVQNAEEDDLFSKMAAAPSGVAGLVTEWLALVQVNGPTAVADVLSLVVRLARPMGCSPMIAITPKMVVVNDPQSSITEIGHLLRTDVPGPVPAAGKDSTSKKLRRAYEDFWRRLTAESSKVVLFDTDCFDTLISWLDAMTTARSRALRMAACLAAYRLVDGLIDFGARLRKELSSMQRQLSAEKRRCGVSPNQSRATGRGKRSKRNVEEAKSLSKKGRDLSRKVDELTAHNSELIALSSKVFDSILVLKYRDVSAEIRTLSVTALGGWILSCPDHFLDDKHTKYIGWLLSDKEPAVRRSTLEVLWRMLRKKDFYSSLEMFLQRFCDRITEMARDKDDAVAVAAIRLLTVLSSFDLLDNTIKTTIPCIALRESQAEVRRAAGEFLSRMIASRATEHARAQSRNQMRNETPAKGRKLSTREVQSPASSGIQRVDRSTAEIQSLLDICVKNRQDTRTADQAIDAVWDYLPAVRCWEAYLQLLKTDENEAAERKSAQIDQRKNGQNDARSSEENGLLCEMLLASVREASGRGDSQRIGVTQRGERHDTTEQGSKFSSALLPELSHLLVQFQADVRASCALVQLPAFFEAEFMQQDGFDSHLDDILSRLVDLISRHTRSSRLVEFCCETLKFLSSDGNPARALALATLQRASLGASKELSVQVRADLSAAQPLSVAASMLKVRVMSELTEPQASVSLSVLKVLQYQIDNSPSSKLTRDVTRDAIRTGFAVVAWCLAKIRARLESNGNDHLDPSLVHDAEKDAYDRGGKLIRLLAQICQLDSVSISCRTLCLQGLLTSLTLCVGVEKVYTSKGFSDPDFLGARKYSEELAEAVTACTLAVVEPELSLLDARCSGDLPNESRKDICLQEIEVRDCFASLVQASMQSVLSTRIAHLPMLGLLIRGRKQMTDSIPPEWTSAQLCKRYLQRRVVKDKVCIEQEGQALREAANISTKQAIQPVRRLAGNILALRESREEREAAANSLLEWLIGFLVRQVEAEDIRKGVSVLTEAGFAILPHLAVDDAGMLLQNLKSVFNGKQLDSLEEDSEISASFSTFAKCIECKAANVPMDIPKLQKASTKDSMVHKKQSSRRRKRAPGDTHAYHSSSYVEPSSVRRSKRGTKRLNYARLSGLEDEDDLLGSSSSEELESDQEGSQISGENVAGIEGGASGTFKDVHSSERPQHATTGRYKQPTRHRFSGKSSALRDKGPGSSDPLPSKKGTASHTDEAGVENVGHTNESEAAFTQQQTKETGRRVSLRSEGPAGVESSMDSPARGSADTKSAEENGDLTSEKHKCEEPSALQAESHGDIVHRMDEVRAVSVKGRVGKERRATPKKKPRFPQGRLTCQIVPGEV